MALIVEDGTGLPTADSYESLVGAALYHTNQGNTAWAAIASDSLREVYLRRATNFMMGRYRLRWNGTRMTMTQFLDWPRSLVPMRDVPFASYYPNNQVPQEVKNACSSLALRASSGLPLNPDQGQLKQSVTVGPISTTYVSGSTPEKQYSEVDAMLLPFFRNGNGQVEMVRA